MGAPTTYGYWNKESPTTYGNSKNRFCYTTAEIRMDMQSGAQKETIEEDVKKNVTKCFAFDEDLALSVCLASPCECV